MAAITPDRYMYNDFGNTSYINVNYIPETFCVGILGQYMFYSVWIIPKSLHIANQNALKITVKPRKFEPDSPKYSQIRTKFGTHWIRFSDNLFKYLL